ncbi:MAG: hypothetical protein ABI877_03750 [Gemmatimonadaceae bacterium]
MQDDRQDKWIDDRAKLLYRAADRPPLDDMWGVIEARLRETRPARRHWIVSRSLWAAVTAAAACLVIGFQLGRSSDVPNVQRTQIAAATEASSVAPYDRTTTALLGETVALLHALPASGAGTQTNQRFSAQATELLLTTRLLLDSPAARDTRLRELLQDLELVLAQIARLHNGKSQQDLELITEALAERDIVPRIRRVAAELASSDN